MSTFEKGGWIETWEKKGFGGKANVDLVKELRELSKKYNVTWIKVKGHADNEYNNECDRLATGYAAMIKEKTAPDFTGRAVDIPEGDVIMEYKKILSVQDISCVGQCSLTVALPILSACGLETCILPSAVLSTHTAGFKGYTFRDLTDDMPKIADHWMREGIKFDALYTGYLGSAKQAEICANIAENLLTDGAKFIMDPAMADNGKLYPGFDMDFVESMKKLASVSDIIVPNITEACLLTGNEYRETYDEKYIKKIVSDLLALGAKEVVLTGIGYTADTTGVVTADGEKFNYYKHEKLPGGCHGTGDVYASAFVGALMRGNGVDKAAAVAADFTVKCIKGTAGDKSHWYGVKFEPLLPELIKAL